MKVFPSSWMKKWPADILTAASMLVLLAAPASARFPVIGYFPSWAGSAANLQYDQLTHINYSFITTGASGNLSTASDARLRELVKLGHEKGTKIGIAVGGWSAGTANFEAMAANAESRAAFIKNLVDLCDKYELDGVDMDWEYPKAASAVNFKTMMKELKDALQPKGRFLSTAVISSGNGTGQHIHKEVFDYIDFLNIMSYDGGGQNHSSFEMAVASLEYWVTQRGCPKAKAILGVPFYGKSPSTTYKALVAQDPQAPFKDNVGAIYYNGIPTMQKKTDLAYQKGGGIMIWEISQDVTGANSLLGAIHAKAIGYTVGVNPILAASRSTRFSVSRGRLFYRDASPGRHDLRIFSATGALVHSAGFLAAAPEGAIAWNTAGLSAGIYAVSLDGLNSSASRLILSAP